MPTTLFFLSGNGHCAARLEPARAVLQQQNLPLRLHEPALPGFEKRPRASSLGAFLAAVASQLDQVVQQQPGQVVIYATGIGGLLALCLRAQGRFTTVPLLLQAPVLWGLEHRLMPRLLRLGLAQLLLSRLFAAGWFQNWFVRRHFLRPLPDSLRQAFFRGYAECSAAADFFAWLIPALLRKLEEDFRARPCGLGGIRVWWGECDHVVTLRELDWTRQHLGVNWPVRTFPGWGHYPMIDEPEDWLRSLADELATPGAFS